MFITVVVVATITAFLTTITFILFLFILTDDWVTAVFEVGFVAVAEGLVLFHAWKVQTHLLLHYHYSMCIGEG